ncbi:carboxypeptidase-like regulatory domain-containing protein [Blastopirellula sp. JC732]|uniref:Carboxypeptidase-like regulatory domain-containing protein n=1 Tax=Blastopirellula sediminis TaxID=2894196 RepID=A0A9X1SHY5_9BACT|nr:carboxypeptidase-like regulatory domain-containing protein [Blastopirellula sediminis]MCC9605742.1 carboxypeptidase-like regulatory domain-containing protein [Blastopirellula sediminis]MCC9630958.1 carboxypeptidase-like regulatory domain-containing protein [Blastopirellula sediminis]
MRYAIYAAAMAALVISGCGSKMMPGGVEAKGVVLLDGTPLEGATVIFSPIGDGRSANGMTDAEGAFSLGTIEPSDGILPGEYQVAIIKSIVDESRSTVDPMAVQEKTGQFPPSPPNINIVPRKFANPQKSGLKANVSEEGATDLKFEIATK